MHNGSIKINMTDGEINCRVLGSGEKIIVAFHGFGQDGNAFYSITKSFSQFTIYSFDLPFHGETRIEKDSILASRDSIVELLGELIEQRKLKNFSLLAFSIGAKCVFPIIEAFGSRIEKVWLLAPDGLAKNFWYQFAIANRLTRYIFRALTDRAVIIVGIVKTLSRAKILNDEKAILVQRSIASPAKSKQVYNTWIYFRKLKPKIGDIDYALKNNDIGASIFLGDRDEVISISKIEKKCRDVSNLEIISFPCSHNQLISNFIKWLEENYD